MYLLTLSWHLELKNMASVSFCINLQKSFLNVRKSANRLAGSFLHTSSGGLCQTAEEPHILKCPSGDVPLSKMPFGDYIWSNVEKHRNRTALVSIGLVKVCLHCSSLQFDEIFWKKFQYSNFAQIWDFHEKLSIMLGYPVSTLKL